MRAQTKNIGIQYLRGIAVISVLLYHFAPTYFRNGYLGVDLFFVISGYLIIPRMFAVFENENLWSDLRAFYIRRIRRLLPAHAFTILITLIAAFFLSKPGEHSLIAGQGLASLLLMANHGAKVFVGDYFNHGRNPLLHLWSLSIEEQIYLGLPLIFLFFRQFYFLTNPRFYSRSIKLAFVSLLLAISSLSLFVFLGSHFFGFPFQKSLMGFPSESLFYSVSARFWELGIGGILGMSSSRFALKYFENSVLRLVFFSTLTFLLISPISTTNTIFRVWSVLIISFLSLFCIRACEFKDLRKSSFFLPIVRTGDFSYPLYLVHFPVILIFRYSPISILDENRVIVRIASIFISFALAILVHNGIEYRWAVTNDNNQQVASFRSLTNRLLLPSLSLCSIVFILSSLNYLGLNPNPPNLRDGGDLDVNCQRDGNTSPCIYGHQGAKFLLIGDSQARSISQSFVDRVKQETGTAYVWTKAGCPFLMPQELENLMNDRASFAMKVESNSTQSCSNHNSDIINFIKNQTIDYIFLSQRSSSRFAQDFGVLPDRYNTAVSNSVRNLVSLSSSIKLFWIGPNIEFPDSRQFFSGNTLIWQSRYIAPKSFPKNEMSPYSFMDEAFIEQSLAKVNNVEFFKISETFCTPTSCSRWNNNRWTFLNMDHLSIHGAKILFLQLWPNVIN